MLIKASQPGTGSEYNTECIFFCCTALMESTTNTKQLHKARQHRFGFMDHSKQALLGLEWPMTHLTSMPSITGPQLQPGDRFALPQKTHPSALATLHTRATWRGPAMPANVTLFQTCQMPWDENNKTSDQRLLYCFPLMGPQCWEYSYTVYLHDLLHGRTDLAEKCPGQIC